MRTVSITLLFVITTFISMGQVISQDRITDWTIAGLRDTTTIGFEFIDMNDFGISGDGQMANDIPLSDAINSISAEGAVLLFPAGEFVFNQPISLSDHIILKGAGADATTLLMDLGGFSHGIIIVGDTQSENSYLNLSGIKDDEFITVMDPELFTAGDWVNIIQEDADLTFSAWAANTTGQIVQITNIVDDSLFLNSPLRTDFNLNREPYINKIEPIKNVGIECLRIERLDNTSPDQFSNIYFSNAVNCWIRGVESDKCTFSHVEISHSSNIHISGSYFHDAHDFGGGGKAYGVMIHFTSNECLVENNIFNHLRHSMILQAGANGNVFAYNYSTDPTWTSFPADAAGDMVLHGNYPYLNLFEHNIGQNIVIDNSHGLNGPYNTFFRNRGEHYGIFFSADNSPSQNLVGNEVTNTSLPQSLVNYTILGADQFLYGNNDEGIITPDGTDVLDESSYAFDEIPDYLNLNQWASIGTPNQINTGSIPAKERFAEGVIFAGECGNIGIGHAELNKMPLQVLVYPIPATDRIVIEKNDHGILFVELIDITGQTVATATIQNNISELDMSTAQVGVYILRMKSESSLILRKIVKN